MCETMVVRQNQICRNKVYFNHISRNGKVSTLHEMRRMAKFRFCQGVRVRQVELNKFAETRCINHKWETDLKLTKFWEITKFRHFVLHKMRKITNFVSRKVSMTDKIAKFAEKRSTNHKWEIKKSAKFCETVSPLRSFRITPNENNGKIS